MAFLEYDQTGLLTNIIDVAGLASSFKYDSQSWATNMITPYGTTVFYHAINTDTCDTNSPANCSTNEFGDQNLELSQYVAVRTLKVVDPVGATNLYMLRQDCSLLYTNPADYYDPDKRETMKTPFIDATWDWSYQGGVVPDIGSFPDYYPTDNGYLYRRNSFHWGPRQAPGLPGNLDLLMPSDYLRARMRHWLHEAHDTGFSFTISQTLSMQREPSPDGVSAGQTTWLCYQGSGYAEGTSYLPNLVSRVLPDSTIWYKWFLRDEWGRATNVVETYSTWVGYTPSTRTNTHVYSGPNLVKHIGPKGNVEEGYAYNGDHQVLRITNAVGDITYYSYDGTGRHTSTLTPGGLTTTNIYFDSGDGKNFIEKRIDLEIARTNFYTYTNNLVHTHTDERGLCMTNTWDALQRRLRVDYPDGTSITNLYNQLDLVLTRDRLGFTNAYGYDAVRRLVAATNSLGRYTLYNYCSCGALDSVRDAEGHYTSFFYDNVGRLVNQVDPDGVAFTNRFNLLGQLAIFTDNAGRCFTNWYNNQGLWVGRSSEFGLEQSVLHDVEDHPQYVTDQNGVTITNTYDDLGRLSTRGYPDGGVERFGYSTRGLIAYTNQLGLTNFYVYDEAGRKRFETNANWEVLRYTNNAAGDLLALVDGKGQVTKRNYDEYGRVTNKVDQAGTVILKYTYDADSRLLSRWSAAKGTSWYTNDPLGNLLVVKYPASSNVYFTYDALNRVTNLVDAVGTTKYQYTAAGRLLTEDGPFASDTMTNVYTAGLRTGYILQQPNDLWWSGFGYDSAKRLTTVTSPAGGFSYSFAGEASRLTQKLTLPNGSYITNAYDDVARLRFTKLNTSSHSTLDSSAYGYNAANQRITFTNAAGTWVTNSYDRIGQLKIFDSSVSSEDRGYTYDASWNMTKRTNYIGASPVTKSYTLNSKNELTSVGSADYHYDANGNRIDIREDLPLYEYDDENRLTAVEDSGGGWRTEFAYDGMGRMRVRAEYTGYPGSWWLASARLYVYDGMRVIEERDANNWPQVAYTRGVDLSGSIEGAGGIGGLLARSHDFTNCSTTLTYWLTNNSGYCISNLTIWDDQQTYVSGAYVGAGNTGQFSFTGLPGRTYYVAGDSCDPWVIQVFADSFTGTLDTRTVDFVFEDHEAQNIVAESGYPLCDGGSSGMWLTHNYYHADGNGNVTALVAGNETLSASYRYDPFGNITSQSGGLANANVCRFSSKEFHAPSGLYYYGYRFYDPSAQRWLTRDPIGERGGFNLYGFVGNSPIFRFDLAGLMGSWPCTSEEWSKCFDKCQKKDPAYICTACIVIYQEVGFPPWVGAIIRVSFGICSKVPCTQR